MPPNSSLLERSLVRFDVRDRAIRLSEGATNAEVVLWVVVVGMSLSDIALTVVGLRVGLVESNPVVAASVERFGLVALVWLKACALSVGLVGWSAVHDSHRGLVPLGLALLWTAVTVSNVVTIVTHVL